MEDTLKRIQHNASHYNHNPQFVTVTHPYHQFRGQRLEFVRVTEQGEIVLRCGSGEYVKLPPDYTDYVVTPPEEQDPTESAAPMHSEESLRQLIALVDQIKSKDGA